MWQELHSGDTDAVVPSGLGDDVPVVHEDLEGGGDVRTPNESQHHLELH